MAAVQEDEAGAVIQGPVLPRKKQQAVVPLLNFTSSAKKVNLSSATNISAGSLRWMPSQKPNSSWTRFHHAGHSFNASSSVEASASIFLFGSAVRKRKFRYEIAFFSF